MKRINLKVKYLSHYKGEPLKYAKKGDAGFDLRAAIAEPIKLWANEVTLIPTGVCVGLPEGYDIEIRPRSGLATKGFTIVNSPGTVDTGYIGEIMCITTLIGQNQRDSYMIINPGDRIAQAVIRETIQADFTEVDKLEETERGDTGFGSSGIK